MNKVRELIRLSLKEWTDEEMVMQPNPEPVKDLEAPEDENESAKDPYSNANSSLKTTKVQVPTSQRAGVGRGSGPGGGGRFPGGKNLGFSGRN